MARPFTDDVITAAIEGFEAQKKKIDDQISELRQMLNGAKTQSAPPSEPPKRGRRLSAAGRKAISDAARRRWAAAKTAKSAKAPAAGAPKKTTTKKAVRKAAKRAAAKKSPKTPAPVEA